MAQKVPQKAQWPINLKIEITNTFDLCKFIKKAKTPKIFAYELKLMKTVYYFICIIHY